MATLRMGALAHKRNSKAVRMALECLPAGFEDTCQSIVQGMDAQNADAGEMANRVFAWLC